MQKPTKPLKPDAPIKPKPTLKKSCVDLIDSYAEEGEYTVNDFVRMIQEEIGEDHSVDLSKIKIEINRFDYEEDIYLNIVYLHEYEIPNPLFQQQSEEYNLRLKEYNKEVKAYEKKLKTYDKRMAAYNQQEKERRKTHKQKEIERAKKLLENNGLIVKEK